MFENVSAAQAAGGADDGALDDGALDDCDTLDWHLADLARGRVSPQKILADSMSGRPGAGRVMSLASINRDRLDDRGQLDYLTCVERQLRWLQAEQLATLAAISARDESEFHWSQESVATALTLPPVHAGSLLSEAAFVMTALPATIAALRGGDISLRHAHAIRETAELLDPSLRSARGRGPWQGRDPDRARAAAQSASRLDPNRR